MSRRPERGGRPAWESEADIMMEKTEQGLGRLCVIGDPVEHSKSPLIQNAMIAKLGIPYHYTKRLVHQGDTQEWLDTARREVREETGLLVEPLPDLRGTVAYRLPTGCLTAGKRR